MKISLSWVEKPGANILLYLNSDGFTDLPFVDTSSNLKEITYTIPDEMTELVVLASAYDGDTAYTLTVSESAE